jgi:hypothetical protein
MRIAVLFIATVPGRGPRFVTVFSDPRRAS